MNDPGLAHMRMQNNTAGFSQGTESSLDLGNRHVEPYRQLGPVWTGSSIDESCDQLVMDFR